MRFPSHLAPSDCSQTLFVLALPQISVQMGFSAGTTHHPKVYPRVRGGTTCGPRRWPTSHGLSPRARGNLLHHRLDYRDVRSIPACAGEPATGGRKHTFDTVYPRVRGGTRRCRPRSTIANGLSPRARGNRNQERRRHESQRSIPACAGEPGGVARDLQSRTVYPRVRGGTAIRNAAAMNRNGLSPRARGNQAVSPAIYNRERSIPACAGEPQSGTPPP